MTRRAAGRGIAVAVATAVQWFSKTAVAQQTDATPPRVRLDASACRAVHGDELARLVSVDLNALLVGATDATATRVEVACAGAVATVRVRDPLTGGELLRTLDSGPLSGGSRTRLLALAVVEMVSASWVELAVPARAPAAVASATSPTPSAPPVLSLPADVLVRHVGLSAAEDAPTSGAPWLVTYGSLRWLGPGGLTLAGGGVGLTSSRGQRLGWRVGAAGEHGDGLVSGRRLTLDVASLSGALALQAAFPTFAVRGSVGARLGLAWLPTSDAPTPLPWVGPELGVGVAWTPTPWFALELNAEFGVGFGDFVRVMSPSAGNASANFWLGASLGLGLRF